MLLYLLPRSLSVDAGDCQITPPSPKITQRSRRLCTWYLAEPSPVSPVSQQQQQCGNGGSFGKVENSVTLVLDTKSCVLGHLFS